MWLGWRGAAAVLFFCMATISIVRPADPPPPIGLKPKAGRISYYDSLDELLNVDTPVYIIW